jgi:deazaflavin-dependent oxidoreductase (nitroreductase family)
MSEPLVYDRANQFQKLVRRFAASGPGSWLFARIAPGLDRPIHRLTRGRHTLGSLLTGLPVVMLTTTGARSGQPRTVPILGIPVTVGIAVIASNWGQARHPGWYHNLRAHPSATVTVRGGEVRVQAFEATDRERNEVWRRGLEIFPGWAAYERRAGGRAVAVFLLVPDHAEG